MKVLFCILISIALSLCEVPPPYPPRGFRPSPAFNLPVRRPQTTYGVPNAPPAKFIRPSSPQIQYGVPNQQEARPARLTPNFISKQVIPSTSYGVPVTSSPYRTIISESQVSNQHSTRPIATLNPSFSSKQTVPSTSYGFPVTSSPYRTIISEPQTALNAPNQNIPKQQYGTPDVNNLETLEQIRQLNYLLQLSQSSKSNKQNQVDINSNAVIPNQQYLPVREPANFRGDVQSQNSQQNVGQPAQQYLPVKGPSNFRNEFDLTQSTQGSSDVGITNTNVEQPPQQYLPVKGASNFNNDFESSQASRPNRVNIPSNSIASQNSQPNTNYQLSKRPSTFSTSVELNQQDVIGGNTNTQPQNLNPSLNYNTPRQNSVEIQQLNVRRLPNTGLSENKFPTRQSAATPLQTAQQNKEFGSSNIQPSSREQVDEKYLPPTTTIRTLQRPTRKPSPRPTDNSGENEQPTESEEEPRGPNIAVATAIAGAPPEQSFYLLQPDGRLQRVIYQKTRSENDRENEYTANYLFQNIQQQPGLVYSPLIAVGKR